MLMYDFGHDQLQNSYNFSVNKYSCFESSSSSSINSITNHDIESISRLFYNDTTGSSDEIKTKAMSVQHSNQQKSEMQTQQQQQVQNEQSYINFMPTMDYNTGIYAKAGFVRHYQTNIKHNV